MGGSEIHAHGARGEKSTSMLFSHVQQKEGSFTSEKEEQREVDVDSPALAASLFLSGAVRACDRAALLPNRSSAGAIIVANESAQESLSDSHECTPLLRANKKQPSWSFEGLVGLGEKSFPASEL